MPNISGTPKFPIHGLAQASNQGVLGDFTIEFVSSGLVGTCYGIPGVSATLVGSGLYDIRYPNTALRGARFYPHALPASPSGPVASAAGAEFQVNMAHVGGQSGMARLLTTTPAPLPSLLSQGIGTLISRPFMPPTGSSINVLVLGSPIARY